MELSRFNLAGLIITGLIFSSALMAEERFSLKEECFLDAETNLLWQQHSQDMTLKANYFWFSHDQNNNGGHTGYKTFPEHAPQCAQTAELCNSEDQIKRHNQQQSCGRDNWRLPTVTELQSLVDYQQQAPATYPLLAPFTQSQKYLTANAYMAGNYIVWALDFNNGRIEGNYKRQPAAMRLVSSNSTLKIEK